MKWKAEVELKQLIGSLRAIARAWRAVMIWTIFIILLVLWLLGFIGHIGGSTIHLLLVVAAIVLVINLINGRRSAI